MRRNKQRKVHTLEGGGRFGYYLHRLAHMDQPDGYAGLTPVEDENAMKMKKKGGKGKGGKKPC
jgi:hypothetical protein